MSHEQNDQQAQMLRGTAWMTASNFISRLLGAAYIIPWYIWMGKYGPQANLPFSCIFYLLSLLAFQVVEKSSFRSCRAFLGLS